MPRTRIVRPVSWLSASINIVVLALFVLAGYLVARLNGVVVGAGVYVLLCQVIRRILAHHHRKAVDHCKRQEFEQAIPKFQQSLQFFDDHLWIDDFRALTMLSSSELNYREMALISIGFCYGQLGDGQNARISDERCLNQFPLSGMALSALKILDAGLNSEI